MKSVDSSTNSPSVQSGSSTGVGGDGVREVPVERPSPMVEVEDAWPLPPCPPWPWLPLPCAVEWCPPPPPLARGLATTVGNGTGPPPPRGV